MQRNLDGLFVGPVRGSPSFAGGQTAADAALVRFGVAGYAASRNEVWPTGRRGASRLSPYIRHGLLQLRHVWDAVAGGPARDVRKFRDELLWQEYARHLYARLGDATARALRAVPRRDGTDPDPWNPRMECMRRTVDELETDGWLVNQTRMWLASQWTVRHGRRWQEGEDLFFAHLLDGSRAANRLGWQWTIGALTGKEYGFSRWQVEKRAPGLCDACELRDGCPIEQWPPDRVPAGLDPPDAVRFDTAPDDTAGPRSVVRHAPPDAVWVTAESLGDADPALAAHPDVPAIFVFDEALLRRLSLSAKRIVFLAESLADLALRRTVEVHRGDPAAVVGDRAVAVTFAPVPGFRRIVATRRPAELHPWPWLVRPHGRSVASFSAWRKHVGPVR